MTGAGSSPDACDDIFCGRKPFSEKESLTLARYLYSIRRQLVAYVDVHTYGQVLMSPWGYSTGYPKDYSIQVSFISEGKVVGQRWLD